mmetsp:Transcript_143/g.516  ORF Transcript_143/g.516 Transcript_143/m.516 type:complete len:144 (+) Transcript_143:44-475(+)
MFLHRSARFPPLEDFIDVLASPLQTDYVRTKFSSIHPPIAQSQHEQLKQSKLVKSINTGYTYITSPVTEEVAFPRECAIVMATKSGSRLLFVLNSWLEMHVVLPAFHGEEWLTGAVKACGWAKVSNLRVDENFHHSNELFVES